MASRLTEITTRYHTFTDDQVLTKDQLNGFISYFEDQDRMTRVFLSGVGIVCGFKLKNVSEESITITQGAGITTDGDLITFKEPFLNGNEKKLVSDELVFKFYRKYEDNFAEYPFFQRAGKTTPSVKNVQIEMLELLPEQTENSQSLDKLTGLMDMTVLLYLESYAKEEDLCTTKDCDNLGIEQVARLRVLLVSQKDAEYIAGNDSIFSKHNKIQKTALALKTVLLRKVVLSPKADLNEIKRSYYRAIKTEQLTGLRKGLKSVFQLFGMPVDLVKFDDVFGFNNNAVPEDFQNRYNFLHDLILSYNEIRECLLNFDSECMPSVASFPKHLLLGKITEKEETKVSFLRHRFYHSHTSATATQNVQRIMQLLERVKLQIDCFEKEIKVSELKIVPSVLSESLGETAIPFYYGTDQNLRRNWNLKSNLNHDDYLSNGYHYLNPFTKGNIRNPLLYVNNNSDSYRIEGQLGMDYQSAIAGVTELIQQYGLDFKLIYFNLDSEIFQFRTLINSEPSLEHIGGVHKGGTFILIGSNNKIIADFSLKYRYNKESDILCCPVREATFPWISSLKYLNNLSRSQKGTKSSKMITKNYRLHVLAYRINDTNFVKGIDIVDVPIKEILKRRMHAVVDALNSRYPQGLVFDYNESQKRFVITYNSRDKFLFRVRDVTLRTDLPYYDYSETGLLKGGRVHRTDAMISREIIQYNNAFYKKLHLELAPFNKDDDNGRYYNKWSEWEKMINDLRNMDDRVRIFKTLQDMPEDIYNILTEIKDDFQKITRGVALRLDGDWVNGTWVDKNMLRESKKDANGPDAKFIQLRELLHNKTGVSKLSVYIYNKPYKSEYDELIKKYENAADFYFTVPSGPHAKEI